MKEKAYHEKVNITNAVRLREQLQLLPRFFREYFVGIEPTTSSRTRLAYAYDLGIFFEYIHDNNPLYQKMQITDYQLSLLDEITALDFEEYLSYLKYLSFKLSGSRSIFRQINILVHIKIVR